MYMNALKEWHESPYTHKKVDAVYAYLKKKNTLMKDLAETKVLLLDENGNLDASAKIQNIPQEKAFVRFVVRQKFAKDIVEENCWLDRTLQDAFMQILSDNGRRKKSGLFDRKTGSTVLFCILKKFEMKETRSKTDFFQ